MQVLCRALSLKIPVCGWPFPAFNDPFDEQKFMKAQFIYLFFYDYCYLYPV